MLSCLAVSAKHLFLQETGCEPRTQNQNEPRIPNVVAVQFYQRALKAFSALLMQSEWAGSDEILASSIMLSCYEIIDVAGDHFGSHLRGVASLLQLWQVNGDSPGIGGIVFWTWFRSDTWAALHARRPMFLDERYWEPRPVDCFDGLSQAEIANRAMYLLGQCINFYNHGKESPSPSGLINEGIEGSLEARQRKMAELQSALEGWRRMLPPSMTHFVAGRAVHGTTQGEEGLSRQDPWLQEISSVLFLSPHCAVGLQMYHASQILLGLNGATWPSEPREARGSYAQQSLSTRRLIDRSRKQILLIASGGLPEAFSFVSTQCLYIAGWVTEGVCERRLTLHLIEQCQKQSGRRTVFIADDLRAAWARDE
ncbi:hypothetical protein A1O3_03066 [Capronia epimyces CBS 606.96]|uniref:Transcription factor domain-containing protein n=1 Tax=Capronia epimyces CBS 606.96 TaxID=1182542 RepID=W9YBW3_9EURO|nr:uncharacterized protein A1O3_03066 [Capronia epimyces CBS 606.96]EXJ89998.1 hypothetical protein A1O3_03066 [Capronia epimyces CBS 606.96]